MVGNLSGLRTHALWQHVIQGLGCKLNSSGKMVN